MPRWARDGSVELGYRTEAVPALRERETMQQATERNEEAMITDMEVEAGPAEVRGYVYRCLGEGWGVAVVVVNTEDPQEQYVAHGLWDSEEEAVLHRDRAVNLIAYAIRAANDTSGRGDR